MDGQAAPPARDHRCYLAHPVPLFCLHAVMMEPQSSNCKEGNVVADDWQSPGLAHMRNLTQSLCLLRHAPSRICCQPLAKVLHCETQL